MMRRNLSRLTCAFLLLLSPVASAQSGDATQSIDSPLGPGTGATLTASQSKTAVTLGLQRQYGKASEWIAAIEGVVDDTDTKTLITRSTGAEPGVTLRLGWAYSQARALVDDVPYADCMQLRTKYDEFVELRAAEAREETCGTMLDELETFVFGQDSRAQGEPDLAELSPSRACQRRLQLLVERLDEALKNVPPDSLDHVRHRAALAHLQALQKKDGEQDITKRLEPIESFLLGTAYEAKTQERSLPSCWEVVREIKGEKGDGLPQRSKALHQEMSKLVEHLPKAPVPFVRYRFGVNAFLGVQGGKFRAVGEGGMIDLSQRNAWTAFLPGVSLDGTLFYKKATGSAGIGYTRAVDVETVKVCRTITQGEFSTEECTEDSIGRPPEQDRLFGSLALSLNPLVSSAVLGDLQLGAQFLALLTTTTGANGITEIDLFGDKSWAYRVSLPVFLVHAEEPWGVAAGFAPELSSAIGGDEPEELRFLFFVGARSMAAPHE